MKHTLLSIGAWSVALGAMGVGAWLAFRPAPVACDIEVVERGPLVVSVQEDGRTRLTDRYVVSAPLDGQIGRVALRAGDVVRAGETVLARVRPVDPSLLDERALAQARARVSAAEAALSKADAELAIAQSNLAHIREEYERVRAAADARAASRQEAEDELIMLRTAEHALEAARFERSVAEYEREQAKAAMLHSGQGLAPASPSDAEPVAWFDVRSPIDGTVLRVLRESEGVVSAGDPLMEVGSLDRIEVELDVLSDQAVRVRPGARVSLERWGGERPLAGVVRTIEPSGFTKVSALGVEEQRVNVIIDFVDGREARPTLGDNFRVEAEIIVSQVESAVCVPLGALFRIDDGWGVFVVEEGRAERRRVAIGQRSHEAAEVLEGLREGDRVIVFPSDRVAHGVRVSNRAAK